MIKLRNLVPRLLEADDLASHSLGVSEPDNDTMAWPPEDTDQEKNPTPGWPESHDGENG